MTVGDDVVDKISFTRSVYTDSLYMRMIINGCQKRFNTDRRTVGNYCKLEIIDS